MQVDEICVRCNQARDAAGQSANKETWHNGTHCYSSLAAAFDTAHASGEKGNLLKYVTG